PRATVLRPLWFRGRGPLRVHGRQSRRRRHHHAEGTVSEVEIIRAVSLGSPKHGFLGRRGGFSAGEFAGLNVGYGSNDERAAIDAAHAVWRGALAGVTDSAIAAMVRLGARSDRIQAAVGPCIGQPSYEVDEAFRARFTEADAANERFFAPGPAGKPHFDLAGYVVHRLIAAEIGEVEALGLDTYADPDRFYSYRRATHRGEADYGRQLSAIALA